MENPHMNTGNNAPPPMKKSALTSQAILRFLVSDDDELDTLILCKNTEIHLLSNEQNMYEAIGSIMPYDKLNIKKLAKLFEVVTLVPMKTRKKILTHERVAELRKLALKEEAGGN